MRVRDHAALSAAGAALLAPALGKRVLLPWAASILIDVDHYLWYCAHAPSRNPLAAVRYFNQAQPRQDARTRVLHSPWVPLALLLLGLRWRPAALLALGLAFHIALDRYHEARTATARRAVLRRDGATCRRCGARTPDVVAHLDRQPALLPSYDLANYVALCGACHEAAHAGRATGTD
jgi:hypothetical protein